jgi:hypothetical protein
MEPNLARLQAPTVRATVPERPQPGALPDRHEMISNMLRGVGAHTAALTTVAVLLAGCGSSSGPAVPNPATMPTIDQAQRTLEVDALELVAEQAQGHSRDTAQALADSQEVFTVLAYYSPDLTPDQKRAQLRTAIGVVKSVCAPCVTLLEGALPSK